MLMTVITGDDATKILQLKRHLFNHFQRKCFLGIEVAQSKEDIVISHRKYALVILEETNTTLCRSIKSPMDQNQKLLVDQGQPFSNPRRYRRQVRNLIYLMSQERIFHLLSEL